MAERREGAKEYQDTALVELATYLENAGRSGTAAAFEARTGRPYVAVPGLEELPYLCLRVPTGGGKTLLAAHSVAVAADSWLLTGAPVVLWLVPSDPILNQTLAGLRDRNGLVRRALMARFREGVELLTLEDALYAKPASYVGNAVVIVSTIQAFRREHPVGMRVYRPSGELKEHFTTVTPEVAARLDPGEDGRPVPSLSNVLRLHRPVVIIDEAHGARQRASFVTLERFSPSLVLEFTATPVTGRNATGDQLPSNVLVQVSAAQLKADDMVKLPILLRGRADPMQTLSDAIECLEHLDREATEERKTNPSFARPVMLIQAQPDYADRPSIHAAEVKRLLVTDFRRDVGEVAISTGGIDELAGKDLNDPANRVRFVVTQQKLKEGWDCPFAYVLCSLADQRSERGVEQLLGRILRLPQVRLHSRPDLNQAYAFATSQDFTRTATNLKDGLVECGFGEVEAASAVRTDPSLPGLGPGDLFFEVSEPLPRTVDAATFADAVADASGGAVRLDAVTSTIRVRGAVTEAAREAVAAVIPAAARRALTAVLAKASGSHLALRRPPGPPFSIPRLVAKDGDLEELFDASHVLTTTWSLGGASVEPVLARFSPSRGVSDAATVDVNEAGRVAVRFVTELRSQLNLQFREAGWTEAALVAWLDRFGLGQDRQDIPQASSLVYVRRVLDAVREKHGLELEEAARTKYQLRNALRSALHELRLARAGEVFQQALLPESASAVPLATSDDMALVMTEESYAYRSAYSGMVQFQKHAFRVVGDLEGKGEEYECAVHLDRTPWIRRWVRNTERQPTSFWLQTSTDRFYPDFLAELDDGRHLVVEYKGKPYATNDDSKEKNLIGQVWAERSDGKCVYTMVSEKQFAAADRAVGR